MQEAIGKFQCVAAALLLAGCGTSAPPQGDHSQAANPPESGPAIAERQPSQASPAPTAGAEVSACLVQDGKRIAENAIHAVGTEPFWAADVKGRCVTYSTPEDQDGTRVWSRFSGSVENGSWTGALDDKEFVMRTSPQEGCSDGMSDKRYPIAVTLKVRGEERRGCAERR